MKKEAKSCSIPYSHTSLHASGQTNFDVVGKSGRMSTNDIYNAGGKASGKFERADGKTIKIENVDRTKK